MDTESPEVEVWRRIYGEHGVEFPLATWIEKVVGSTDSPFDPADHLAVLTGKCLDAKAVWERAYALRPEYQAGMPVMPGAMALLRDARRLGLRMAVVSSSSHKWVEGHLEKMGAWEFFELFICQEDAAHTKPAPDLYLKALEKLGLAGEECLVFEDSPNGVKAAHEAGIRVVGVPNPITAQGGALGADLLLNSLEQMPLEAILARFDH